MSFRKALIGLGCGLTCLTAIHAFQKPFREYPGTEYNNFPAPAVYRAKSLNSLFLTISS